MTQRTYMLCEDCHRVLWVEDGPVCPECLEKRGQGADGGEVHWDPDRQQIVVGPEDDSE